MDSLPSQVKTAIEALVPLVRDDGDLHETTSLVSLVYETPFHLDYLCSLMTDQTFPKLERLNVIHRTIRLYTAPFLTVKRFKSWKGKTVGWRLDFIDPLRRLSYETLAWAKTRDEAKICKKWWDYVAQILSSTDFRRYGGDGDSMMYGRFKRAYKTEERYEESVKETIGALGVAGFNVEHKRVFEVPKEGMIYKYEK